ncbi:MAG: UDP-N-acetylmuramate dehydrogenase [Jatrophihabitans sp.]|uniref:UDP-N-acetylmuramate dehydrogenase n=1 Tax=Jatrophihabitans sp. TaxID=1932789 RepID=UPI0039126FC4
MPQTLAELTTLRLGGPAARVIEATSTDVLVDVVRSADASGEPVLVVGGGSNLVVSDDGWDGLVVLVRSDGYEAVEVDDSVHVTVAAGHPWDAFVATTVEREWSGLAAMSGIPGLTGATPIQNVGAYGSEVSDVVVGLRVLDRGSGAVEDWSPDRCGFGFRTSAFKHTDRYVVLTVTFGLRRSPDAPPLRYLEVARRLGVEPGESAPSADVRKVVLELRRSKGMVLDAADHDTWSVGSFFVNPFVAPEQVPDGCPNFLVDGRIKLSAAWLIENAGFGKGFGLDRGRGSVALSTKHTLALTNRGTATTAELLDLARVIRDGVESRFGIRLRPEAHLVGVEL